MEKKKNTVGIIIVIVVALVGCGLIGFGFSIFSSPKNIMITTIDTIVKAMSSGVKNNTDQSFIKFLSETDKVELISNNKLTIDEKTGLGINDIDFNFNYIENGLEKKSAIDFDLNANDTKLIGLNTILSDNKAYFKIKEAFKNYYYSDAEYFSIFNQVNVNNYDIFRKLLVESLQKTLKDSDFSKEKTTITVNGEDTKVTKNTMIIDSPKMTIIAAEFFDKIKDNEEASKILMDMTNSTKSELSTNLDDILNDIKDIDSTESVDLNVYIQGFNNVVLTEFTDDSLSIKYYTYKNTKQIVIASFLNENYDDYTASDIENKMTATQTSDIYDLKLVTDNNNTNIIFKYNDSELLTGTITSNDDKVTFDLQTSISSMNISIKGDIETKEVNTNSEYTCNATLALTLINGSENYLFNLASNNTFKIADVIDTSVLDEASKIDEISEEDANALLELPIFQLLMGMTTDTTDSLY